MTPVISIFAAMVVSVMPFEMGNQLLQHVRVTCKQVSSCEEAVQIWCNGYRRADGDSDGIPCENVCYTLEQVNDIRQQQGC
ncbi:excalibur calcium-binding domain-containing protein [Rhizobium sp. LjRoot254]|uniref:excalibur calcium-binding domain-containing protein n=1 Tax=Rhizobium sp. LjRoot254 TaxID=3342297 RepID=UPI003ED0B437